MRSLYYYVETEIQRCSRAGFFGHLFQGVEGESCGTDLVSNVIGSKNRWRCLHLGRSMGRPSAGNIYRGNQQTVQIIVNSRTSRPH